jgi:hypothetical protein
LSPPTACFSFLIAAFLSLLHAPLISYPDISSFVLSFLPSHREHKTYASVEALPPNKAKPVEVNPEHKSYATLQALPTKAQPVEVCHHPLPASLF